MARGKWFLPFKKNKLNYEDVGYPPYFVQHDIGFNGDKIFRAVKWNGPNSGTFSLVGEVHSAGDTAPYGKRARASDTRKARAKAVADVHRLAGGKLEENPKAMTFKQLSRGDKFIFEGEVKFPYSGIAKGPWVKTGSRTYSHVPDDGFGYRVGSINAKVIPQGQSLRMENPVRRRKRNNADARELELYIENDAQLYRSQHLPIIKNLELKKAKGIYDHAKAVKLFRYLVDRADKLYFKEYGNGDGKHVTMSTATRNEVAESLAHSFETESDLGNYRNFLPKKYQKNPAITSKHLPLSVRRMPDGDYYLISRDGQHVQVKIGDRTISYFGKKSEAMAAARAVGKTAIGSSNPRRRIAVRHRRRSSRVRTRRSRRY